MPTVIEEFVAVLGWEVDAKPLKQWNKQVADITKGVKIAAAAIATATVAASAFIFATNKQTAEVTNLAAALGVSANELEVWGGLVKGIGFDAEKVGDLIEELNNKMGEGRIGGKLMSSVADATKMLGLNFDELKKKSPEDQFTAIMSAAKDLEDQQKAVSAVDMLMGGDANRILGFLRTQEGSLEDILERRRALIMLDDDARDGAVRFNNLINDTLGLLGSLGAQFSGLAGKHLAPMLDQLINWVTTNRELIKTRLTEFVDLVAKGLKIVFEVIRKGLNLFFDFIEAVGGLENAFKLASIAVAAFAAVKVLFAIKAFIGMIKSATAAQWLLNTAVALIPALIALGIVAVALIAEDIYQFATGGESVLGDLLTFFSGMFDEMVIVAEEYIASAIEFFVAFYDEMVLIVEGYIDSVVEFFVWLGGEIKKIYDEMVAVAEGAIDSAVEFVKGIWGEIEGIFAGLLEWPKKILKAFGTLRKMAIDKLKGLPLIGGLFGSSDEGAPAGSPAIPPGSPSPSPGVTNNAGNTNNSKIVVSPTLNVTQLPGESGEDFAARVNGVIGEKVAIAVRNNETGIVY